MIRVIASDLDGTLLYPKRRYTTLVHSGNKKFVRDFIRQGGRFVIASGRGVDFCKKIEKSLRVPCDIIAYNGGLIMSQGSIIEETFLPLPVIKEIHEFIDQKKLKIIHTLFPKNHPLVLKTWELTKSERFLTKLFKLKNGRYNEIMIHDNSLFQSILADNNQIYKMSVLFQTHYRPQMLKLLEELTEKFGHLVHLTMMKNNIEINPLGVSKGSKLMVLTHHLGISNEEVAVVGDDFNDISMFEHFPNSFGIKSGAKEAIQRASKIVKHVSRIKKHL